MKTDAQTDERAKGLLKVAIERWHRISRENGLYLSNTSVSTVNDALATALTKRLSENPIDVETAIKTAVSDAHHIAVKCARDDASARRKRRRSALTAQPLAPGLAKAKTE